MLLARAWLLSLAQLITASSQLTVELGVAGLGDLLGSMSRTAWSTRPIYQFQGVPYAKSPGRHNRFKVHLEQVLYQNTKYLNFLICLG